MIPPVDKGRIDIMQSKSLRDLYVAELRDLHSAERQLVDAFERMAIRAHKPELKTVLGHLLDESRQHVDRLEQVLAELNKSTRGKKCVGMSGLIQEGIEIMRQKADPAVQDAGLIGAAQRIEHYKMAGYGTVRSYARALGYDDAVRTLQMTLDEEGKADHQLTALAIGMINPESDKRHPEYGAAYYTHQDDES
jgi:ferritin-like metal-binding protein YciE